jgi:hypothetical protein
MFAGYSERPTQVRRVRVPTGEKGIGRFAADKLGQVLEVYTRQKGQKEGIHLSIDWRDFEDRAKKFNEVDASYTVAPVPQVTNTHGTTLEIHRLRGKWDAARVDALRTWLNDLLDPFQPPDKFTITLEVAGARTGLEVMGPVLPDADLLVEVSVVDAKNVQRVIRSLGDDTIISKTIEGTTADVKQLQDLNARFLYFHKRPNKKLSKGLEAGVRVYRDGFRTLEEHYGDRLAAPTMLTDLVEAGRYGVKQGGGFVIPAGDQAPLIAYRNTVYARLGQPLAALGPAPL